MRRYRPRTQAACDQSVADELRVKTIPERIDWDCLNRLKAFAAEARAELGEARWAELQAEWRSQP